MLAHLVRSRGHRADGGALSRVVRNLPAIVGEVLEALGQDPRLAPAPALQRQANERSDEWVDRYHNDARELGLPV